MKALKKRAPKRRLVLDMPAAGMDTLALVMGPDHPVLRGAVRIVLEVEGEAIAAADVQVGFSHRGFEKEAESTPYANSFALVERLNYVSPLLNAVGFALALESLLGVTQKIPERAQLVRVIVSELARVADHINCLATTALSLGVSNACHWLQRARAELWQLLEAVSGPRLGPSFIQLGGVANDLDADWPAAFHAWTPRVRRTLSHSEALLGNSPVFRERTVGVACIKPALIGAWGLSGPVARASGVAVDVRKDAPYLCYDSFDFDVPVGSHGDNWDRYALRMEEMRQSLRIVEQALKRLRPGPICYREAAWSPPSKDTIKTDPSNHLLHHAQAIFGTPMPAGQVYSAVEGANGELGFFVVSDGSARPVKCRVRSPSFMNAAVLAHVLPGHFLADVVPSYALLNIVGGECDR